MAKVMGDRLELQVPPNPTGVGKKNIQAPPINLSTADVMSLARSGIYLRH